jgi:hypothetical protein
MVSSYLDIFTPADIAQRAQDLTHAALSKRIGEIFADIWGADWAQVLNQKNQSLDEQRRKEDPTWRGRPPFKIVGGKPAWDFAPMLYALIDHVDELPRFKKNKGYIKALCRKLRDGRNTLAHKTQDFDPNNVKFAKEHIETSIALMRAIDGKDAVVQVQSLHDMLKKPPAAGKEAVAPAPSSGAQPAGPQAEKGREEIAEIRKMLEELLARGDAPRAAPVPPPQTPSGSATGASAEAARPRAASAAMPAVDIGGRRRGPIPTQRAGVVLFPVVGGSDTVSNFGYVSCNKYHPERRQDILALVTGFVGHGKSDVYYQAISDARFSEADPSKATLHTHAQVDPGDFGGSSFGLAAAIADKAARYGLPAPLEGRHIIATGVMAKGGHGEVAEVDSFDAKLRLLELEAPAGSVFVFPVANIANNTAAAAFLERLRASRQIISRGVSHIAELDDWFRDNQPKSPQADAAPAAVAPAPVARVRKPLLRQAFAAAIVVGIAALASLYFVADYQSRSQVDPVAREHARNMASTLANLSAAIRANPDDWDACAALTGKTGMLNDTTLAMFPVEHRQAVADAQQCTARLGDSTRRLSELKAAAASLDPNLPGTIQRMALARKALTTSDLARLTDEERGRLVVAGDQAQSRLDDSDRRITPVLTAHNAWRISGGALTTKALAESARPLTDFDRARSVPGLGEALRDVDKAANDLTASANRWSGLQAAVDRAGREPIEYYWTPLRIATDSITSLDRDLATSSQRLLLTQAQKLLTVTPAARAPAPFPTMPAPLPGGSRKPNDDFGTIQGPR